MAEAGIPEEEEVAEPDLGSAEVVTKYRMASDIVQNALRGVMTRIRPGASVLDICRFGDDLIEAQCTKVYKNKKVDRGVAFPTCVSVNECVCHYSPLVGDDTNLAEGDIVKLDLGAHVDGFIAVAAHTMAVPAAAAAEAAEATEVPEGPEVTGKAADVIAAAHAAAEIASRLIKPGNTNEQVTEAVKAVADAFGVVPVQGVLMHQMKQFVIDGNKVVIQREEPDQKVDDFEFEVNEVYAVDVCFSTGEGKPTDKGTRTTVFKRAAEQKYRLKMKASRFLINEVSKRFPSLPFTLRALGEDERQARMGVVECVNHGLLHPYPVLYEKEGDHIAHFKFTVLLLPSGNLKVTGMDLPDNVHTDKALPDELRKVLEKSVSGGSKKKRKKNKKKGGEGEGGAAEA